MTRYNVSPPTWRGFPVPWVALWSAEMGTLEDNPRLLWTGRLAYEDEIAGDRRLGALWIRYRLGRHGEPLFGQLHAARQRLAMTKSLCQICGGSALDEEGRTSWLLPSVEFDGDGVSSWTTTAPTCAGCQSTALRHCPHLRSTPPVRVSAGEVIPAGVLGDLYQVEHGLITGMKSRSHVPFGDADGMRRVLAKQLTVELRDVRVLCNEP